MANTAFKAEHGLFVQGNANVAGNLNVTGDFNVGGTFTSAVQATGDLKPATDGLNLGNTTFRWNLFGINVNGRDLSITNSASISNTLTVTGVTTLQNDLTVDGSVLVVNSSSNRVGINVSNPTTALDVSGTIKATSLEGGLNWSNVTSKPSPTITVSLSGDVSGSASASLDALASNTVSITTTIQQNSVALGTDTTGDYVASISGGTPTTATASGLNISGTGEGAGVTIAHSDTSTLADTSYSGGTVLNGFTVDNFGHMLTFATINLDSRYVTTTGSFETSGTITTASPFTVKAQGAEGGEIVLKKGTGQTALNGDAIIDTLATSVRFFENGGTFRQFNFDFSTGNITNPSSFIMWHSGNDGPGSGLDADSVDGYAPGNASSNIPINNGTLNTNLNADFLDGEHGSYYSNATNLSTGTVPNARLSGTYGNALTLSNSGNVLAGNGNSLTSLNASQLLSGTVPSARLDTSYTSIVNITASGTIQANALEAVAGISTGTTGAIGTSRLFINSPAGQTAHPVRILINSGDIFTISPTGSVSASGSVSATSFSGSGANITSINATNISTGTVNTGRLGTGTASSSTFLRGDGTWATPPATDISITTTSTNVTVNSSTGVDSAIAGATTSAAGVMTATDKTKLDGIGTGASVSSVATGNGLTGGTITTSGTISAVAHSGISVTASGIAVNAQNGLTANSLGLYVVAGTGIASNSTGVHVTSVPNALTFSDNGGGNATGSSFNGSAVRTISYNSIGAPAANGAGASGSWAINVTGSAGSVAWTNVTGRPTDLNSFNNGPGYLTSTTGVTTQYNSTLNADSRNSRGVTRLFRRDVDDDYSVQTYWTGSVWRLYGYNGDTAHADVRVGFAGYADSAGSAPASGGTSDLVTINYNNDSNASYQMLWGSGNGVYGTSGIYCNPSQDKLWATGGFGLTGSARLESGGLILQGVSPTIYLRDTDGNSAYFHCNSNLLYILRGGTDTESWTQVGGQWPAYWDLTNNNATFGGSLTCAGNVTAFSDLKLKENITTVDNALQKVNSLRGVYYTLKSSETKERQVGVIAQEVQDIVPEVVMLHQDDNDKEGTLAVDYSKLTAVLIEAVKELTAKVEVLEKRLNSLA